MRKLARLAIGAAALALVAAGTSCGQQSPQQPRNQAQQTEPQRPQPQPPQNQAQQTEPQQPQAQPPQNQAQQTEPQPPQPQPPQNQAQQTEPPRPQAQPPQNQAQQTEPPRPQPQPPQNQAQQTEPPRHQAQQPQNQAQPAQQSANENSNQSGGQNTAKNPNPAEIRQIQQALEQKGFKVGGVDGMLGPRTKQALSQFQRKQGLQQTGMPDEQTLAALGIGGAASTTGQGRVLPGAH